MQQNHDRSFLHLPYGTLFQYPVDFFFVFSRGILPTCPYRNGPILEVRSIHLCLAAESGGGLDHCECKGCSARESTFGTSGAERDLAGEPKISGKVSDWSLSETLMFAFKYPSRAISKADPFLDLLSILQDIACKQFHNLRMKHAQLKLRLLTTFQSQKEGDDFQHEIAQT